MNVKSISDPRTPVSKFSSRNDTRIITCIITHIITRKRAPWLAARLGPGEESHTQKNSKGEYTINGYPVKESNARGTWSEGCASRKFSLCPTY